MNINLALNIELLIILIFGLSVLIIAEKLKIDGVKLSNIQKIRTGHRATIFILPIIMYSAIFLILRLLFPFFDNPEFTQLISETVPAVALISSLSIVLYEIKNNKKDVQRDKF